MVRLRKLWKLENNNLLSVQQYSFPTKVLNSQFIYLNHMVKLGRTYMTLNVGLRNANTPLYSIVRSRFCAFG